MEPSGMKTRRRTKEERQTAEMEKVDKIAQMRLSGYNWADVAKETGFKDGSGAWRFWKRHFDQSIKTPCEEYRTLITERLERLLRAVWLKALGGSVPHVDKARAVIADLRKLHGLDMPELHQIEAKVETTNDVADILANTSREEQDLLTRVLFPTSDRSAQN